MVVQQSVALRYLEARVKASVSQVDELKRENAILENRLGTGKKLCGQISIIVGVMTMYPMQ